MQFFQKIKSWLSKDNNLIWTSVVALMIIGLLSVYFLGAYASARLGVTPNYFFDKSFVYVLIGLLFMILASRLSNKSIIRFCWVLGIFGLLMILLGLINPTYIAGSARYVKLGSVVLNPFVITLPAYVVLVSHWLSKENAKQSWVMAGITLVTLFIAVAAFMAPYVFMTQVYLLLFFIMGFKARKNTPGIFYTGICILIILGLMMAFATLTMPHIQHKILNFGNYATQTSVHAITSSALVGNTPESLASLSRLPGLISDFMFTGIIAKFGILMGLLVLALYGFVFNGLTHMIHNAKDKFSKMLSFSTLWLLAIYVIMAVMVAFGLLSTASYWPFISFGGTTFIIWCMLFGFVLAENKK